MDAATYICNYKNNLGHKIERAHLINKAAGVELVDIL